MWGLFDHTKKQSLSRNVKRDALFCSMTLPGTKQFILLFFILHLSTIKSFAQTDSLFKDSLIYHKVLLVQFEPMMYLSDAEQDIVQKSEKKFEEHRMYLRKSLDHKIAAEVEQVIPCYSLLNDKSENAAQLSGAIYSGSSYRYAEPMKLKHAKSSKPKSFPVNSKENNDSKVAPQYLTTQGDAKYMNAVIENKDLFEKLNKEYGTDLFLFINQFEIKTNYNTCIDIERHVYKREVIVSYSMYDAKGKQVDGNLAHSFFPSDSNRDSDIAERVFPQIAASIANHVKALALK